MKLDNKTKVIKVLMVEDIVLNQLLMKMVLDNFGFEHDIAENGKIVIEKLKKNQYDIVLMDLQMQEMNGFEVSEYIRKTLNLPISIIALTTDVTVEDLVNYKAVGMNDYITKPIDERVLHSKIVGLMQKLKNSKSIKNNNSKISEAEKVKCINLDYLNNRTKSNPKLIIEMIDLYLQQTPQLINILKQSFIDKDWDLLYAAIHKIIPSFSIVGIHSDFENLAKKIQEFVMIQQQDDEMEQMIFQLEKVCMQACKELEQELQTLKNTQK